MAPAACELESQGGKLQTPPTVEFSIPRPAHHPLTSFPPFRPHVLSSANSYIGRKRMQVDRPEKSVPNIHNLVEADYSYWTLGYMISLEGAMKLLRAEPLKRMLPVDEFLPIMFNKHPE